MFSVDENVLQAGKIPPIILLTSSKQFLPETAVHFFRIFPVPEGHRIFNKSVIKKEIKHGSRDTANDFFRKKRINRFFKKETDTVFPDRKDRCTPIKHLSTGSPPRRKRLRERSDRSSRSTPQKKNKQKKYGSPFQFFSQKWQQTTSPCHGGKNLRLLSDNNGPPSFCRTPHRFSQNTSPIAFQISDRTPASTIKSTQDTRATALPRAFTKAVSTSNVAT